MFIRILCAGLGLMLAACQPSASVIPAPAATDAAPPPATGFVTEIGNRARKRPGCAR